MRNLRHFAIACAWLLCYLPAPTAPAAGAPDPSTVALVDVKDVDPATRLTIACLQGIVNRSGDRPALYRTADGADRAWFDQLYAPAGFRGEALSPKDVLARFADRVKGQVIYDPDQPETINLATALAGLEDALPVARDTGLKTVQDLRGRFRSRLEAARWAQEELLPRCSSRRLALLSPDQVDPRDYLVAEKILPVGLDPKSGEEAKALRALLEGFAPGALLFWDGAPPSPADARASFGPEQRDSVASLARTTGKRLIPGAGVANLSFHARVPSGIPLHQAKRQVQYTPVKYVTFLVSANGALDFAFGRMRELWDDPVRGFVPLAWEAHPLLAELAPALLGFYYTDARWGGSDDFVMAPSGAAFLLPTGEKAASEFLAATEKAARDADLRVVSLMDAAAPDSEKPWLPLFALPDIRGAIALGAGVLPVRAAGRPVIGDTVRFTDPERTARAITEAAEKQRFVLVVADAATATPTGIAEAAARLGPGYAVIGPHQFLDLLAERDSIEGSEPRLTRLGKLKKVTFSPGKPGPDDPLTVKATIAGDIVDARVIYSMNGSPDFAEPLVRAAGEEYQAVLPPVLAGGELKFKVRVADGYLITTWSAESKLRVSAPDADGDGLSDIQERIYGLDAARKDSDGDGLCDANDPAPLAAFPRPPDREGPIITEIVTLPRTPPAAGKKGTIQAAVFDPSGVAEVSVRFTADERDLGGGAMKEVRSSQRFQRDLPPLKAGQKLTAVIRATSRSGKTSEVTAAAPVSVGVMLLSPLDGAVVRKTTTLRVRAHGEAASIRLLVNGAEVAKLTKAPYEFDWNPFPYEAGTHEIVAEAYDDEGRLIDFDLVRIRILSDRRHR